MRGVEWRPGACNLQTLLACMRARPGQCTRVTAHRLETFLSGAVRQSRSKRHEPTTRFNRAHRHHWRCCWCTCVNRAATEQHAPLLRKQQGERRRWWWWQQQQQWERSGHSRSQTDAPSRLTRRWRHAVPRPCRRQRCPTRSALVTAIRASFISFHLRRSGLGLLLAVRVARCIRLLVGIVERAPAKTRPTFR